MSERIKVHKIQFIYFLNLKQHRLLLYLSYLTGIYPQINFQGIKVLQRMSVCLFDILFTITLVFISPTGTLSYLRQCQDERLLLTKFTLVLGLAGLHTLKWPIAPW